MVPVLAIVGSQLCAARYPDGAKAQCGGGGYDDGLVIWGGRGARHVVYFHVPAVQRRELGRDDLTGVCFQLSRPRRLPHARSLLLQG